MKRRITVRFPADRDNDYYFRVYNWADELWGPIITDGLGTLGDIDRVRDLFWIDVSKPRDLPAVLRIIKKTLHKHGFDGDYVIEK